MLRNGVLRTVYVSLLIPGNFRQAGSVMSPCMLCAGGQQEGQGHTEGEGSLFLFPKHPGVCSIRVTPCSTFLLAEGSSVPKNSLHVDQMCSAGWNVSPALGQH